MGNVDTKCCASKQNCGLGGRSDQEHRAEKSKRELDAWVQKNPQHQVPGGRGQRRFSMQRHFKEGSVGPSAGRFGQTKSEPEPCQVGGALSMVAEGSFMHSAESLLPESTESTPKSKVTKVVAPPNYFKPFAGLREANALGNDPPVQGRPAKALLIGINYTGSPIELQSCHSDALDMREILIRQYGFGSLNIRMMLDKPGIEFEHPTRLAIMENLRWLAEGAQEEDCLFFHFGGHGGQERDPLCKEEDCMNETILPVDYSDEGQIVDDELFEVIVRGLPSGVKLTAVMDCCHAGTGLDLPFTLTEGSLSNFYQTSWTCHDNPNHSEGHVVLISGCCDDQGSADSQGVYDRPRGALTEAFLYSLKWDPQPSYINLITGMRDRLLEKGYPHAPSMTSTQQSDVDGIRSPAYDISGGIVPNQNALVGRFQTRNHVPRIAWRDDDPFCQEQAYCPLVGSPMDAAAAVAMAAAVAAGGVGCRRASVEEDSDDDDDDDDDTDSKSDEAPADRGNSGGGVFFGSQRSADNDGDAGIDSYPMVSKYPSD